MHVLAVTCLIMASVTTYTGIYYLVFYAKRRRIKEHLPFALLCLSVGIYNIFSMELYSATSLEEGIFWQGLQFNMASPISIFLIWVSAAFTGNESRKGVRYLIAWFIVLTALSPLAPERFTLSPDFPSIKHVTLFNTLSITYYEGVPGLLCQALIVSAVCAFGYFGYLFYEHYRKTGHRQFLLLLGGQFLYFVGVLNDALVALGAYSFIYISEYTFSFIIMAMAYLLFDKFVGLHYEVEGLNRTLEQKVYERSREIERLNDDLKRVAEHDALTGVFNRRFFNEYFEIEMKRAISNREHKARLAVDGESMNFGLAVIDVDHFKLINDTYGHMTGDSVLMQIIAVIQENIFARDVLCRYGGDEFSLILTKTSQRGIFQAAEKIRREIDEHSFIFGKGLPRQHVTVSIGLVNFDELITKGREEALKLADDRLAMAKIMGRNRIIYGGTYSTRETDA